MKKHFTILLIGLSTIVFSTCGIFWMRKHDPKAKFLYIDLKSKTIYCNPPDGGISKINVFLYSKGFTHWVLKSKVYANAVNKIELADELRNVDSTLLKKHELHIQIWNSSPVIFDYGIYVLPENWDKKKTVYGWWNAR